MKSKHAELLARLKELDKRKKELGMRNDSPPPVQREDENDNKDVDLNDFTNPNYDENAKKFLEEYKLMRF